MRPCCKVSHFSRFDGDSLDCEGVICKRLQIGNHLPLEILFHCSLVQKIFNLLTGFGVINPDVVKPHNPVGIDRVFPGEINFHI